jgi:hypothetical protein
VGRVRAKLDAIRDEYRKPTATLSIPSESREIYTAIFRGMPPGEPLKMDARRLLRDAGDHARALLAVELRPLDEHRAGYHLAWIIDTSDMMSTQRYEALLPLPDTWTRGRPPTVARHVFRGWMSKHREDLKGRVRECEQAVALAEARAGRGAAAALAPVEMQALGALYADLIDAASRADGGPGPVHDVHHRWERWMERGSRPPPQVIRDYDTSIAGRCRRVGGHGPVARGGMMRNR